MNPKLFTVFFFIFIVSHALAADSPGKTKVILGSVLIGGGAALTAYSISNFCLGSCAGNDAAAYGGLAMMGTGTALLVWGLIERSKAKKSTWIENPGNQNFLVGLTLIKNGVAGGVCFRW
jgi:hypothetical protein